MKEKKKGCKRDQESCKEWFEQVGCLVAHHKRIWVEQMGYWWHTQRIIVWS